MVDTKLPALLADVFLRYFLIYQQRGWLEVVKEMLESTFNLFEIALKCCS